MRTQPITAVDLAKGRIRIPIGEKAAFPATRERIVVRLKGVRFDDVAWDPRFGPDRERSGVIYIGPRLASLTSENERLEVTPIGNHIVLAEVGRR